MQTGKTPRDAPCQFFDRPFFQKRSRVRAAPEEAAFSFRQAFSFGPIASKEKASSGERLQYFVRPNLVFCLAFFQKSERGVGAEPTDTAFLFCQAFFFVPFASKKKASAAKAPRERRFLFAKPFRSKEKASDHSYKQTLDKAHFAHSKGFTTNYIATNVVCQLFCLVLCGF